MRKFDTWSDQNQRLAGEQWYALLAHVIARAAVDATSDDPLLSADALAWLNSEDGRLCLGIFGFTIAGAISPQDLRVQKRNIYYGYVSRETFLAGHDAGGK